MLRKLLDVVEWRLSDRNNPRFPEIEAIGALYLEGVKGSQALSARLRNAWS